MCSLQTLRGLTTAIRTLSSIPVPGRDASEMASALPYFPLVGAFIGSILVGISHLFSFIHLVDWPGGAAFLLLVVSIALTRGIHLDGLADTADGFFSMTDRERTLAIMKDSRVGTFGVLAIVTILGLKWLALSRLISHHATIWILPAAVGSRTIMASLAVLLPYARKEGGCGAPFVKGARSIHLWITWILAILCHLPLGPLVPIMLFITLTSLVVLRWIYSRRIGGITGDLLGAASEITETAILFVSAALIPQSTIIHTIKAYSWLV